MNSSAKDMAEKEVYGSLISIVKTRIARIEKTIKRLEAVKGGLRAR